ncbi:Photosystem I assembly protein Ycf3 [Bienertia sinuspersici]
MGGGGAMRAAAKVAGIGVINSGIRSSGSIESPVNVAVRPALSGLSSTGLTVENPVQKPVWEIDDWEFAGSENDEFVVDKNNSAKPRLVFGPVPTIEETKEATIELKDALDKVYLSSPKSEGSAESASALHETKACITHESSVSKSAMQAFRLLHDSAAAQTVVASIACDPNVWNAVMQNPTLVEFLESEKSATIFENQDQESTNTSVHSNDANGPKMPGGLMAFLENVKITVVDMVQNLTNLVQSWFNAPEMEKSTKSTDGSTRSLLAGGSFMGLAMMVIMVVVMKRA